jgi:hypothetical protein
MLSLLQIPEVAGFSIGIVIGAILGFAGGICATLAIVAML